MPRYQRVSFGTGHLLFALSIALWFNYSVTFFTKVLEISPSGVGTIVLVGQVVGAVSAPIVGIWSDHTPSIRGWGRRNHFSSLEHCWELWLSSFSGSSVFIATTLRPVLRSSTTVYGPLSSSFAGPVLRFLSWHLYGAD